MRYIPKDARIWNENDDWYGINVDDHNRVYLKKSAPLEARTSYEKYCKIMGYPKDRYPEIKD